MDRTYPITRIRHDQFTEVPGGNVRVTVSRIEGADLDKAEAMQALTSMLTEAIAHINGS